MKRIRYLTLLVLLSCSIGLWAQEDNFNPVSPAEPGPPGSESGLVPMLNLMADPAAGGTVSGAGWYDAGTQVTLRAYNKTDYVFTNWTNSQGEIVSTSSQFKYTMPSSNETLTAHFRFSPGSPAEPTEIAQVIYHQLSIVAGDGGTVSGGGKYLPNTRVNLKATVNTGFVFSGWYDEVGTLISSAANFYYTTQARPVTLTARFTFNPSGPGEPTPPNIPVKHTVTAVAEDGGTVNASSTVLTEGGTVKLTATTNTGYVFLGWYVADTLYTTQSSFTYTMGTADIAFTARFRFNPASPADPSETKTKMFTFTLYNRVCRPGDTVKFPVYLTTTEDLYDMDFQLTFPKEITPTVEATDVSAKAEGYTVNISEITDPELLASASVDETAAVYTLLFAGGHLPPGNTVLLNFTLHVGDEIPTGQPYQVRINQVSMTLADESKVSAATRNGRVSVYKRGDVNGDDSVNLTDADWMVKEFVGKSPDGFIGEVADMDDDEGPVNLTDANKVVRVFVGKE